MLEPAEQEADSAPVANDSSGSSWLSGRRLSDVYPLIVVLAVVFALDALLQSFDFARALYYGLDLTFPGERLLILTRVVRIVGAAMVSRALWCVGCQLRIEVNHPPAVAEDLVRSHDWLWTVVGGYALLWTGTNVLSLIQLIQIYLEIG